MKFIECINRVESIFCSILYIGTALEEIYDPLKLFCILSYKVPYWYCLSFTFSQVFALSALFVLIFYVKMKTEEFIENLNKFRNKINDRNYSHYIIKYCINQEKVILEIYLISYRTYCCVNRSTITHSTNKR